MQKSLAKLSIFCENAKGFDLFCLFLLINQEKLRKIFAIIPLSPSLSIPLLSLENSHARQVTFFLLATKANLWIDHVLR